IGAYLSTLADDIAPLDFISDSRQGQRQIWISGRNSKGPLHFDLDDNIHVVIRGRKRFYLFDYSQIVHLYAAPALSSTPHYSLVDVPEPDLERFPRFQSARGYQVSLGRGDMIYIPQGCWHQVVTEQPSVAINFWLGKHYLQRAALRV